MAGSLNLGHVVGPAGQGVASGGTTGQYLKKASSADYDAEWASFANATQSAAGMMSAADKTKLDGLPASAAVPGSIAIMSDNNTHAAITSGQFVYVRNHGTLAEGLYIATANIAQNGTLSSGNLSDVPGGGLNSLNSKIATVTGNQIGVIKVVEGRNYGHALYFPAYVGSYGISFGVVTASECALYYLYLTVSSNGTITKSMEKVSINGAAGVDSNYCTVSMK